MEPYLQHIQNKLSHPLGGPFEVMNRPADIHFPFLSSPCDVREVGSHDGLGKHQLIETKLGCPPGVFGNDTSRVLIPEGGDSWLFRKASGLCSTADAVGQAN